MKQKQKQQLPTETADRQKAAMPMRSRKRSREVLLEEMDASLKEMGVRISTMVEQLEKIHNEFQQLQRQLEKYSRQDNEKRGCNEEMEGPTSRWLQLKFNIQPSPIIFTMTNVEGEKSDTLHLTLVDPQEETVSVGPESSMQVELVLVTGEFMNSETGNWTLKYFEDKIVQARKGKPPLLSRDVLKLDKGVAEVGNIKITDNSSWLPSKDFRLAARVTNGYFNQTRIKEAITYPFVVKERRLKPIQKHQTPCLGDHVWRLKGIFKDGKYHQRLKVEKIDTVEDFTNSLEENINRLRYEILKMTDNDAWEETVKHARTSVPCGEEKARFCKHKIKPGLVISEATEVVKQQSVQTVYEQHEVVGVSSKFRIRIQNDGQSNHQQFGRSSLLQHDITSQPFPECSHTAVAGTSASGDTLMPFGSVAPFSPGAKSPVVDMSSFPNEFQENDGHVFRPDDDFEIPDQDCNFDYDIQPLLKFLESEYVGSADECFDMPSESAAVKYKGNLKWWTLVTVKLFSMRIVALKRMQVSKNIL